MMPALVDFGRRVGGLIRTDLGVSDAELKPGQGRVLFGLQSMLYALPVAFHYLQYFERIEERFLL